MRLRPLWCVSACAAAFIAWRCIATIHDRVAHAAEEPMLARGAWLTADHDQRIASTFGADAVVVHALQSNMRPTDKLLLYGTLGADAKETQKRLGLMHYRLQFLLYPTPVSLAIGPLEHGPPVGSLLTQDMLLINLTPGAERPLADRFEVIARGDGFELSRARSSP